MFGQSRQNKELERKQQEQIAANQQLYKRVFDNEDGKAVLKDLEKRCFINSTTYDPDEKKMGINEGRRSIFFYITNLVNKDIQQILEELTKS